ncbi:MAG TPA: UDP-N-acetylmuramoyl-tripeptide--D-alanyl-D-alanine ligase [Sphingobacteriaceae bacterium]|nr:UDP-N-acetylmuramoyl-tripeptide--D-alanyl-D-alanine ligase [Sphingobacteriaceae bacterium]
MEIDQLYKIYLESGLVSTDTRKIPQGCLFFALKGESFDGNSFAQKALEAGAAYAIIDNPSYKLNDKYILVPDALKALQQLAQYHRSKLQIPVIGITGTNGKTTTKELVNCVLSQKFKTYATQGNLNNHIGVPLTLLAIGSDTEIAIVEMGANHQEEIKFLCGISQPGYGLITNIGKAHLEGFGGPEGVKKGKGELYDWLVSRKGKAFINRDNPVLVDMARERGLQQVIYYGTGNEGLVSGELTANDPFIKIEWRLNHAVIDPEIYSAGTHLTGNYNLENILSAVCIGTFFGLSAKEINEGLSGYQPSNNRSQITKTSSNTLICDYYNANPSSMAVALDNFVGMQGQKKAVILGDMFELGEDSAAEHKDILKKALNIPANEYIFVGEGFYKEGEHRQSKAKFFRTTNEAYSFLKSHPIKDAVVLVKGSRGMHLEKLIELL